MITDKKYKQIFLSLNTSNKYISQSSWTSKNETIPHLLSAMVPDLDVNRSESLRLLRTGLTVISTDISIVGLRLKQDRRAIT